MFHQAGKKDGFCQLQVSCLVGGGSGMALRVPWVATCKLPSARALHSLCCCRLPSQGDTKTGQMGLEMPGEDGHSCTYPAISTVVCWNVLQMNFVEKSLESSDLWDDRISCAVVILWRKWVARLLRRHALSNPRVQGAVCGITFAGVNDSGVSGDPAGGLQLASLVYLQAQLTCRPV